MATRKKVKVVEPVIETVSDTLVSVDNKTSKPYLLVGLVLILGLGFLLYKTNNFPVVAMVGMRPITRYEINRELYKQSGKTMVDNLVTEVLINNELKKSKVVVSDSDINEKIESIKKSLGEGQDLNTLLSQRGMTLNDVKKQLRLQMGVEKVLADKVTVSNEEITKFVTENANYMTATSEAGKIEEATTALKQQKTQTEVTTWIQSLKDKTKVWYADGNVAE
jgi:foldase protein PrsA